MVYFYLKIWIEGVVYPCPLAIYMYVTLFLSIISKTTWPIKSVLYVSYIKDIVLQHALIKQSD